MASTKLRTLIVAASLAAGLNMPGQAQACCWCHSLFGAPAPVAAVAPPYISPGVPVQSVSYVPQTAYRTVYSPVPVTTLSPVTSCDPCSGCPTTSMVPTTTYVQRPVVVPYTTYRPVYSTYYAPAPAPACCAAPACGCGACGGACATPAPATTYYQPSASYYQPSTSYYQPSAVVPGAPGCGCAAHAAPAYSGAPVPAYSGAPAPAYNSTSTYAPAYAPPSSYPPSGQTIVSPAPNGTSPYVGPATSAPTISNGSTVQPQNTYAPVASPSGEPPMKPIPDIKTSSPPTSGTPPLLLNPNSRTTSMPMMRSGPSSTQVHWASAVSPVAEQPAPANADGWHAVR